MLTNFKIYSLTASGWLISAVQVESALRIASLCVTICLSLAVYLKDKKNRNNDEN